MNIEQIQSANCLINKAPKRDKLGRAYGTGRRKVAVARVWIKPGTGKVTVNGSEIKAYFKRETLFMCFR